MKTNSNPLDFSGKVALVTGSSRGIGQTIASTLASCGSNLMLNSRNESVLIKTVHELRKQGYTVEGAVGDVAKGEDVKSLVQKVMRTFGKLDVVVHNAGIYSQKKLEDITDSEWRYMLDVNLTGAFHLLREVIPIMKEQQSGNIVVVVAASPSNASRRADYNFAKGGLRDMIHGLAKETGPFNILINAVAPSFILTPTLKNVYTDVGVDTEQVRRVLPLRRFGTEKDVAYTTVFLASPANRFLTGQTIFLDGGYC